MSSKNMFTIGECMQKSGVSVRALRYYDNIDLLKPSDYTEGGHRLYSNDDLAVLQKIKALQFLGFSLKDIKTMIQHNIAHGEEIVESLNNQKRIFEAKKLEITHVLSDLFHLIETIEGEETINIHVLCAMLQKLMFEEDTKKWFEDHFSEDVTTELLDLQKSAEVDLDKKWMNVLSDIKRLSSTEAMPSSAESQQTIKSLVELMNETTKGNLDVITEELPSSQSLSFPNPFSEKEQEFLKKTMEIYQRGESGVKEVLDIYSRISD